MVKNKLKGKGITDYFVKLDYNNISKRSLDECGKLKIKAIQITRTPINKLLNVAFDTFTLGQWSNLKKKYGYDELFHLSLLFFLEGGKECIVEKNEVVNVNCFDPRKQFNDKTEFFDVKLSFNYLTIQLLLDMTMKSLGREKFFKYNAFDQGNATNCQGFIREILKQGKMLTPEADKFLYQNFEEFQKELPGYTKFIANTLTDLGATFSRLMGNGKKRKKAKKSLINHFTKNKKDLENKNKFFKSVEKWIKSKEIQDILNDK